MTDELPLRPATGDENRASLSVRAAIQRPKARARCRQRDGLDYGGSAGAELGAVRIRADEAALARCADNVWDAA